MNNRNQALNALPYFSFRKYQLFLESLLLPTPERGPHIILDTRPIMILAGNTEINAFMTQVDIVTLLQLIIINNFHFKNK